MSPEDSPPLAGPHPSALLARVGTPRRRWKEWLVVGVAVGVAWPLWNWRGHMDRAGMVVDAPITLITSDRENLSCALDRYVGRRRCRFRAPGKPWAEPAPASDLLAPYVTVEHRMYLVPGLFELPELVARYAEEPPGSARPDKLRRFVARCKLRLVERVERFEARWFETANFGPQTGAWVAEPISCKVE